MRPPRTMAAALMALFALAAITACTEAGPAVEVVPTTPSPTASAAPSPSLEASAAPVAPAPGSSLVTADNIEVHVWPSLNAFVLGTLDRRATVEAVARLRPNLAASDGPRRWVALRGLGWLPHDEAVLALPTPYQDLAAIDPYNDHRASAPLYPPDTRTGVPAVDPAIEAVTSGNLDAVEALVFTYDQPCGKPPVFIVGHGNPEAWPCGDPDVEAVRLFHISICEGERKRTETLPQWVAGFFDPAHDSYSAPVSPTPQPLSLYAVLAVPAPSDAAYLLVFAFEPGGPARTLWLDETGAIRGLGFACGADPVEVMLPRTFPVLLPPNAPPPLQPRD